MHLLHQAAIRLDEVRGQPRHVGEARDACAQVIHGHPQAEVAQPVGVALENLEVVHALGFRELHYHAARVEGQGLHPAWQAVPEARRLEADGLQVHEVQVAVIAGAGQGLEGGLEEPEVEDEAVLQAQGGILQDGAHGVGDALRIQVPGEVLLGHEAVVVEPVHGLHVGLEDAFAPQHALQDALRHVHSASDPASWPQCSAASGGCPGRRALPIVRTGSYAGLSNTGTGS